MVKTKSVSELVEKTTREVLGLLGVAASLSIAEKDGSIDVQIDSDQAGVLIGYRGEAIASLQLLVKQIVYSKYGDVPYVSFNVGDWRQKREETLTALANSAAYRAKHSGQAQHIYDLSPSERRFVHLLLENNADVATESEGEGRDRHLVVKSKN